MRVNCNVPFGLHRLLPLIPRFTAAHLEVRLDIVLTDQVVDLMDARADIAVRVGPIRPSQLMARKLGQSRMAVVAAPAYLARRGVPQTPYNLDAHNCIAFNFARYVDEWSFIVDGIHVSLPAHGDVVRAMARFPAVWLWPARESRDSLCSTSDLTSTPDDLFRCLRPTIPAMSRRSTSSMWATAAGYRLGCEPSSISWSKKSILMIRRSCWTPSNVRARVIFK